MDLLDFTEEEIAEQLAILGYRNIPQNRLQEFKRDLDELIQCANWEELAPPPLVNATQCQPAVRPPNPPAYTKEKVGRCYTDRSGEGFFLHKGKVNYDREWFEDKPGEEEKPSTCFPALFPSQELAAFPSKDHGCKQGHTDSYAQHSVARKLQLPPGVASRLQMKPHSEETLDSSEPSELSEPSEPSVLLEPPYSPRFPDRYSSSADGQGRRVIKRKVLRRREGRSLVCDESVYSDDSAPSSKSSAGSQIPAGEPLVAMYRMYNCESDRESDDGDSFWSDGENKREEEEEEVEVEVEVERLPDTGDHRLQPSEGDQQRPLKTPAASDDSEEEDERSSSGSPVPSLMTSGYGTYRAEGPDGGDAAAGESDQDSRGDLSEARDDEEEVGGFPPFDAEPPEDAGTWCQEDTEGPSYTPTRRGGDSGGGPVEPLDREAKGVRAGDSAESPEDASSNKDIRFIDSKLDSGWRAFEEWEGNLRPRRDVASSLEERLADLQVASSPQPDSETESEDADSYDSYISDLVPGRRETETRPQPKSFIRPILKPQGIKKSDPVTKYRQYAELWKMIKFPGERERRDLHHDLQNRLAYQPPPPRTRRVYVPNKYIVPTDKKRSALRWEIRHDLANGIVPRCNYRF